MMWYGMHLYTYVFVPLFGFLFYSVVWGKKTTKYAVILDLLQNRILNFTQVYVC